MGANHVLMYMTVFARSWTPGPSKTESPRNYCKSGLKSRKLDVLGRFMTDQYSAYKFVAIALSSAALRVSPVRLTLLPWPSSLRAIDVHVHADVHVS